MHLAPVRALVRDAVVAEQRHAGLAARAYPLVGQPSLTVTRARAAVADNIVPDACDLLLDRRLVSGETEQEALTELRALLERIRGTGAARMGMVSSAAKSREESPATPLIGMISPPADYRDELHKRTVQASEVDLVSRLMFMQQMHKTYAGTSTVCTGVASRIPGTIVNEALRQQDATPNRNEVRIGHPAGVIETEADVRQTNEGFTVHRATLGRTARRIMEGYVFTDSGSAPQAAA